MRILHAHALLVMLAVGACGGDATGPSYESIAGSYAGPVNGISQGVALSSSVSFTLAQSGGTLSGTWSIAGSLSNGLTTNSVTGTGTLAGTVGSGNNPSVNISVLVPGCPAYHSDFTGAYDVANRRITITGSIDFFANGTCTAVLSYPGTLIINR